MNKEIKLSDHFTYSRLCRFTLPCIASMLFTSIYGIVDGFFVSNYVGKIPFTGLNIIMPFIMILGAVGNMIGMGGSALIGKTLGEGNKVKANSLFSFLVYFMTTAGIILAVIGQLILPWVAALLGAEDEVLENAILYGRVCLCGLPFLALQYSFQAFFITAEKPKMGLVVTVVAGITNIILDALFVAVLNWGLAGAAIATVTSQVIGSVIPIIMFSSKKNTWILKLGKAKFEGRALMQACANGSSEFLSNVSMSIVGMLYNAQLLKYAGNDGVAAYGVIMYVNMIFISIFFGFTTGTSPLLSYNYGSGNNSELKNLFKKAMATISVFAVVMMAAAQLLARPLALIFTSYDEALLEMTVSAFTIYAFSFLFCGFGIFGSGLFTALNNGLISAVISVVRTVVFQIAFVFILPLIWELDGIWLSAVFAEGFSAVVAVIFIIKYRKKYNYV